MNFENWPVNTQLFDAPTDRVCLDEYGRVFVDRDPTYFRMIVTQLLKERDLSVDALHVQCGGFGDKLSIQRLILECTEMDLTDLANGLRRSRAFD